MGEGAEYCRGRVSEGGAGNVGSCDGELFRTVRNCAEL
jgi:hypothetical protein